MSVNLLRVGPAYEPRRHAELLEETPDDGVGVRRRADVIEAGHDPGQRLLDVVDSLS